MDFDKLEAARQRLGIHADGEGWPEEFNDPAFSRRVLGLKLLTADKQLITHPLSVAPHHLG